ncbi:MAG: radical SAM protein [Deltaproteobacteria bacterium]|nr:radical SAM protein [Deltaproteobacteria bacterium]
MGDTLPQERRSALHVAVSDACNNSCVFCLNARVDGRIDGAPPRPPAWEEIRGTIDRGRAAGLTELAITIAEPTLGKHLVRAVRHAREIGFERVAMNTNGRLLGRGTLLDDLLAAGLSRIVLSLHGPEAGVHDPLAGRAGAFAEVLAGLEKLAARRPESGFNLQVLCVVCRPNLAAIEPMWRFFERHARPDRGDGISFTALKTLGLAADRFADLGVPYGELVDHWLGAWRSLGAPPAMMLSEVPGCVVLARAATGPVPAVDVPDARFVREGVAVRNATDPNYAKRDACRDCRIEPVCPGVMERYVATHGWDEFPPVRELPAASAPAKVSGDGGARAGDGGARAGDGAPAVQLACMLLGTTAEALARGGLSATSFRRNDDGLAVGVAGPGGFEAVLQVAPRDDTKPAYLRTPALNVSYSGGPAEGLLPKLLARVVRAVGDRPFADLAAAWDRAAAAAPPAPSPAGDPAAPAAPDLPLEESFGDTACGMMGAVDVIKEVPSDIAVVVHGDRGCLPTPEGASAPACTSDMREIDVVGGGEARLLDAVRATLALGRSRPAAVVLVGTCLSEMIGDDLDEVAARAEAEHGLPVVPIRATGLQPLRPVEVARRVHGALAARFLTPMPRAEEIGLVGYPDDERGRFHSEVRGVLAGAGVAVGGVWPRGGLDGLRRLAAACVVLAPERVAHGPLLDRLDALREGENRPGPEVAVAAAPFGLSATLAFYREVAIRMGKEDAVRSRAEGEAARAAARVERFRGRHAGLRVAVSFGNNRKGTGAQTTVHLGVGYVPFLVELGLEPVLVALTGESDAQAAKVRALAGRLGASAEVHLHRRPEGLVPVLAGGRFSLATNESCQKHFVDAAKVPYLHFMRIEPGFGGMMRSIDAIEAAIEGGAP